MVLLLMAVVSGMFFAGCGARDSVAKEEVSYAMTFCNQTEQNVSELQLRPLEDYNWTKNLLQDDLWEAGFEVPVNIDGLVPVTDGWQVKMIFENNTEQIWKDVALQDGDTLIFSLDDGTPKLTHTQNKEDADDANDVDDTASDMESEEASE